MITGLESILLSYAVGKIIDVSSMYLGDRVLTRPEKKKLTEIVETSLTRVFTEQALGKNGPELKQLQDSFSYLLNQQYVLEHIASTVFVHGSSDENYGLGEVAEYHDGLVSSHEATIVKQLKCYLAEALILEAQKKGSPLFNTVSVSLLAVIYENTNQIPAIAADVNHIGGEISLVGRQLGHQLNAIDSIDSKLEQLLNRQNDQSEDNDAVQSELQTTKDLLSNDVQSKIDSLHHVYRTGNRKKAFQALIDIQEGDRWEYFDNVAKAKILRRRAVWELNHGTPLSKVKEIATKAIDLDAEADHTVLDAVIAYNEDGYQAAIDLISTPKNAFSYNFLLALKLVHDGPNSVLVTINKNEFNFDQDSAENMRLNALALLYSGSPEEALSKLNEITGREVDWRDIKLAKALVLFWQNIGTAQIPEIVEQCPMPLDVNPKDINELCKQVIRQQFQVFWSDAIDSDLEIDEAISVKLWALSCLIYGGATSAEVNATFKIILDDHSTDPRVLWWGMCIDGSLISSELAIEASSELSPESVNYVQKANFLLPILFDNSLFEEALKLLEKSEERFVQTENRQAWIRRKAQYFALTNQIDTALMLAKENCVEDLELQIRVSVLMIASQSKPEDYLLPLASDALNLFLTQQISAPLYQALSVLADKNEWRAISSLFGQDIPKNLPLDVAEIITFSLFNDGRFKECGATLQLIMSRFAEEQLSINLLRILVLMSKRQSNVLEELKYAKILDALSQFSSDKLLYIQALLANGYKGKLLQECLAFSERDDVTKADLLGLAQIIKSDDRGLALHIIKKLLPTISGTDNSREIVAAYHLCFELGLESEIGHIHQLVAKIAHDPNDNIIWMGSLDDVLKLQQESKNHSREQNRMYAKGFLPLHSIVKRLNTSVSTVIFQNRELSRQEGPANLPSIYIRHGGTVTSDEALKAVFDRKLHLDTSAILVADTIGALELILDSFEIKELPPSIQKSFREEVDSFPTVQVSRVKSSKEILKYIWSDTVKVYSRFDINFELQSRFDKWMGHKWIALLNHCIESDGFIVDFFPLTRNDGSTKVIKQIRKQVKERIINARCVIDSLYQSGRISDSCYHSALAQMGDESRVQVASVLPPLGSDLYCIFNTIEVLYSSGLFDLIAEEFNLKIDPQYFDEIKATVQADWEGAAHQSWFSELQNRFVVKDDSGSDYSYFALSKEREHDLKSETLICLNEVMMAEDAEGIVCWVDDRCIHSFRQIGQRPIVTTYEMLRALYLCEKIAIEDYYGFLIKLRSLNYKYIPLEPEELLFHVNQAKVGDHHLLETQELALLRRYYNSCLVSWNNLQLNPLPENCPNQSGELYFLHEFNRSISSTISKAWASCNESNLNQTIKQVTWVFDVFYTGTFGIRHLRMGAEHTSTEAREDEIAVDAGLGLIGVLINAFSENGLQSLEEYQKWIIEKLVEPIRRANPECDKVIAQMLVTFLKKTFISPKPEDEDANLIRRIMRVFVHDLPDGLKAEILKDNEISDFCGLRISTSIVINGDNFELTKFWGACANSWAGKKPYIQNFDGTKRFKFSLPKDLKATPNTIIIKPNGQPAFTFQSPIIPILTASKDEMYKVLKEGKDWIDLSEGELDKLVNELDALTSSHERGQLLSHVIEGSPIVFYDQLNNTLAGSNSLSIDALLPKSPERLVRYLRLDGDNDLLFGGRLINAAALLVEENGLNITFDRLAGIPIILPNVFLAALDKLENEDRCLFFKKTFLSYQSPVYRVQLLALLSRYKGDEKVDELFQIIWGELHEADKWRDKVASYHALLTFLDRSLNKHKNDFKWPSYALYSVLWAHASLVLNFLIQNRMALDTGAIFFAELSGSLERSSLFSSRYIEDLDVLSPELFGQWDFITQLLPALITAYGNQYPKEVSEFYQTALFPEEAGVKTASLALAFNPSVLPNATGSPLGFDRSEVLEPYLNTLEQGLFSPVQFKGRAVELMRELMAFPEKEGNWAQFFMYIRNGALSSDTQSELLELSNSLNLNALALHSPQALFAVLSMMPMLIFQTRDLDAATKFREQILNLTDNFEFYNFEGIEEINEPFDRLVVSAIENALITLSAMQATPWEQSKQFSEGLYAVYYNLSKFYPEMSYAILKLVLGLPVTQTNGLWETLIAIRSRT